MDRTPWTDRQFSVIIATSVIVIGAICALAFPFLNFIPPEDFVQVRILSAGLGGIMVLVGISKLWAALGRQPKSAFLRRARAFLSPDGQILRKIVRDNKCKAKAIWILVVTVLIPLTALAGVIEIENNGRAWISVIAFIILNALVLLSLVLCVSLFVRIRRIALGELDD
ncbi:MAG: hypothetical protein IH944_14255 [Armatimonadetes bacterium]|nr:hypothetical protein [Armatimonadota bacterium]